MIVFIVLVKCLAIIAVAPLFQGFIKRAKAYCQGRQGPPLSQPYFDFMKFLHKEMVVSREVSWVFHVAPLMAFSAMMTAAVMVPWIDRTRWGFFGDLVLFVYLLAIPRFMMALAGLDASGAFGGMASSREMVVSALAEPALLLSLLTLALPVRSLRLETLMGVTGGLPVFTPPGLLAALAFYLVLLAEMGRIPVDNPDTHLELTMIHEGLILEYSGPNLGLLHLTHWIKQVTLAALMMNAFAPLGMATEPSAFPLAMMYFGGKLLFLGLLLALTETLTTKMRLFQMLDLMGFSFILAVTSLLFVAIGR